MLDLVKITSAGKIEPGSKEFQRFIQEYPANIISILASYFSQQGAPEKGVSLLISALEQKPEEWELYDKLVFLTIKAGKSLEAEKKLLEALALYPDRPDICGSLGKLYFLDKKYIQAKELLEKSLNLRSEDGVNHFFLALCRLSFLKEEERIDGADFSEVLQIEKGLQRAKELNPEVIESGFLNGEKLLTEGNFSQAFNLLERSLRGYLEKKTQFTQIQKFFLQLCVQIEELDLEGLKEEIFRLEKRLNLSPSSVEEHNQLGCAYLFFFVHLVKSAEEQLEKALSLDPEFEGVLKGLELLGRKRKEIISLIESLKF